MKHRITICLPTLIILFSTASFAATPDEFGLRPGHLYGNIQGGVREYTSDLVPVADLLLSDVTVTEGLAFSNSGELILSAFKENPSGFSTHHVLKIDASGDVVDSINLLEGGLDRVSHAAVDQQGRAYVSSRAGMVESAHDFGSFQVLSHPFDRTSGVAVDSTNRLFVTDSNTGELVILNTARNVEHIIDIGGSPLGIDFDAAGNLFLAARQSMELREVDLTALDGSFDAVLTGLDDPSDIAFAPDGSYYLSLDGAIVEHRSADHQLLGSVSTLERMHSLAVLVPEPSCLGLGILSLVLLGCRRRPKMH